MANNYLGATRKGLKDWLLQRISAVYIFLYLIFSTVCLWCLPANYQVWRGLWIHNFCLLIANILLLLAVMVHAWIGGWTVITDYINSPCLRLLLKWVLWLFLFSSFTYGVVIFIALFL